MFRFPIGGARTHKAHVYMCALNIFTIKYLETCYLTAKTVTVSWTLHNYKHEKLIIKKFILKNTNSEGPIKHCLYNLYILQYFIFVNA
jgi:hypothetical protein